MSSRSRQRHRRSRGSVGKKILLGLGVLLVLVGGAAAAAAGWVYDTVDAAGTIEQQKEIKEGANTQVFAADGSLLGIIDSNIVREPVGLKEIPKDLQQATIAIEDEHFYEHNGVDYGAIIRAAIKNAQAGEVEQGASTITQQLIRNLYIKKPEDTLQRKLIEAKWAMEYEKDHTKDQILEKYLNTATYGTNSGDTAVGVESASQVYFNKHVSDLNLGEAALLAGLPQAPSEYNPFLSPDQALKRRNLVLKAMSDQGYISQADYRHWTNAGLGLQRGYRYETRRYQYFFDYVQQQLIDKYGTQTARVGGLRVYTTIVPRLQDAAQQAIADHPTPLAAEALVSVNVDTGEIQAMASSSSYDVSEFNLAAQGRRQPGSSFKPYALAEAVDEGIDPDSTYYPAPASITLHPDGPYGAPWQVSGEGGGTMNLRDALAHSINTVFAQLAIDIGPENMDAMAKKLGVQSPLSGFASDVLGASDVTVLDQADAYATFANGGVHHNPTSIAKVVFPNGDVDDIAKEPGNRVISDGVASVMEDVMQGPLDYGTAACCDIPCPAAGKTGTTEEQSDAWFVGYTPHISTAVWVGNPNERVPLPGYGADLAAPIWHDYMIAAASQPCDDFPEPQNPVSLTAGSGGYAVARGSSTSTDSTSTDTPTYPAPGTDADGDGKPDDAYAPGAGNQDVPGQGTGTGGTGTGGTTP
jgi:penicillin-binding protein 1A